MHARPDDHGQGHRRRAAGRRLRRLARADGAHRAGRRRLPGRARCRATRSPSPPGCATLRAARRRAPTRAWRATTEALADGPARGAPAAGVPVQVATRARPADRLLLARRRCATTPAPQACDLDALRRLVPRRCSRAASTRRRRSSRRGSRRSRTTPSTSSARSRRRPRRSRRSRDERAERARRARCARRAACSPTRCAPAPRRGRPRWARSRRPARARGHEATSRSRSRRSARATCCTTARRASCDAADPDLALLAGDRLYALGPRAAGRRSATSTRSRELADVISLCAQAHAAGDAELADAVWEAGAAAIGWGDDDALEAAKAAARRAIPARRGALRAARAPGARDGPPRLSTIGSAALDSVGARIATPWPIAAQTKSQVHRRPQHPRRLRGRDRHAPALHDRHGARRRRRRRRRRSLLPGARLRARAGVREARRSTGRPSARPTTSPTTPTSRGRSRSSPGIGEVGKTTVYVRKRNPEIDTEPRDEYNAVHRDLDALHAPRLPGALRRGRRSASSARATAASTTSAAWSPAARRCARSTASTRACENGQVEVGPRFSVNSELERFSPRDPGEPLDGIGQYLYPSRPDGAQDRREPDAMPKLPAPPLPARAQAAAQAPGRGQRHDRRRSSTPPRPGITVVDWIDERTSLSRRRPLDAVPQGPEGDQLVLHARLGDDVRLPHPGGHRRLPGDVLRPVADARVRVDPLHHQRRLPRRVRARHAQVGLDR